MRLISSSKGINNICGLRSQWVMSQRDKMCRWSRAMTQFERAANTLGKK